MNTTYELINTFYTCFQNKDYKGIQACYADNAFFSDPVFKNLDALEVKSMWEMFCKKGKHLRIEFANVAATEKEGSADWTAYYTFSQTGKKVINRIHANFKFQDGKIVEHIDSFNFYNWAKQALGIPGLLLGWTSFIKTKVQKAAMKNLEAFMKANKI